MRAVDAATTKPSPSTASSSSSYTLPRNCARVSRVLARRTKDDDDVTQQQQQQRQQQSCEFYIIGTSHKAGKTGARRVRALVDAVRPSCVVLELDQERADALLLASRGAVEEEEYGADLLAGLLGAERLDALTIYGDRRARGLAGKVFERAMRGWGDDGGGMGRFGKRWSACAKHCRRMWYAEDGVDVGKALREDPESLGRPLVGPGIVGLIAALVSALEPAAVGSPDWATSWIEVANAATLAFACVAFCPFVETFWMDRDDALADAALAGAEACHGVASGRFRRVTFEFSGDAEETKRAAARAKDGESKKETRCFTLKRPLDEGETRRLNLWEPRWLSLMDTLAEENGGNLVGAELGCLLGRTRHYRDAATNEVSGKTAGSRRRRATVIVEDTFRRARVVRVQEGRRPTTKARKLEVWIEGLKDVSCAADVKAHPAGYLLAKEDDSTANNTHPSSSLPSPPLEGQVVVVVVCGLAHVNGVVERLSSRVE